MARLVMKLKQPIGRQRESSVGSAVVIAEFDFVYTGGESFDNRADLTAQKAMVSDVCEQRNHR
jgi:hypothetical protein